MGVDFVYEPQVGGFFENNPTPEFDFFATASTMLTNKTLYPTGFSSPRAPSRPLPEPQATLPSTSLPTMLGLYFEDDWRATPRLLLNLGLRYDREIGTYGIANQANSRTHQEIVAASKTNVPTVPTTQTLPRTASATPPASAISEATTPAFPRTTTSTSAPASASPSTHSAMAASFSAAVTASTSARPSRTFRCS